MVGVKGVKLLQDGFDSKLFRDTKFKLSGAVILRLLPGAAKDQFCTSYSVPATFLDVGGSMGEEKVMVNSEIHCILGSHWTSNGR